MGADGLRSAALNLNLRLYSLKLTNIFLSHMIFVRNNVEGFDGATAAVETPASCLLRCVSHMVSINVCLKALGNSKHSRLKIGVCARWTLPSVNVDLTSSSHFYIMFSNSRPPAARR